MNDFLLFVNDGNLEGIKETFSPDLLNTVDSSGDSALHIAVLKKNLPIVQFLIENGADVNIQNKLGKTALHHAGEQNAVDIAKLIIAHGGRLDIYDSYNNGPLWTATYNYNEKKERFEIVELFLKHGADKNHKNNAGRSPLDFANQIESEDILRLFSQY